MHRIKASQLKQTCAGNASSVAEGSFGRRVHGESRGQYLTRAQEQGARNLGGGHVERSVGATAVFCVESLCLEKSI